MTDAQGAAALELARGAALVLPLHTPDPTMPGGCSCRRRDCPSVGKHPRTLNGHLDATADLDTVTRWWSMWPTANIGVRPHPGHVVLDIDPRAGGAVQAVAMQERYERLPGTLTASTGGAGWHVWLRHDGPTVGKLAAGLDLKGHDGFLVAPPSLHASGRRYRWTNTGPIVAAPAWFSALITRPAGRVVSGGRQLTERRTAALVRVVAEAKPGDRNSRLHWAACRVLEAGGDPNPLITAALAVGLSRGEAERTVASAASSTTTTEGTG